MNKSTVIAFALLMIIGIASAATVFGWVIGVRFYFGLLPFTASKSASVAMIDEIKDILVVRPISDGHQLRFMNLIVSVLKGEEPEVVYLWKNSEPALFNRTLPRYSMGWVNPTKIMVFGAEYDVSYLEMWVREETLYLNIRYQDSEYVTEKLFLIENPGLAAEAFDLMVEAWSFGYIAKSFSS